MEKLTAIIPVFNEAHHIEAAILSVLFADEILIVDSFSTDETLSIAKKFPVKILQREYEYSASQKNWAIPQATHNWIFILDADERVTPQLQEEIQQILSNPPQDLVGYWVYRNNHFIDKKIKYSGWQNDKLFDFLKKTFAVIKTNTFTPRSAPPGSLIIYNIRYNIIVLARFSSLRQNSINMRCGKLKIMMHVPEN